MRSLLKVHLTPSTCLRPPGITLFVLGRVSLDQQLKTDHLLPTGQSWGTPASQDKQLPIWGPGSIAKEGQPRPEQPEVPGHCSQPLQSNNFHMPALLFLFTKHSWKLGWDTILFYSSLFQRGLCDLLKNCETVTTLICGVLVPPLFY